MVKVSLPFSYLEQPENKLLTPLQDAEKMGDDSALWQCAYLAVKHDRANYLKEGNLRNFISAHAALYILNLYYNDYSFDIGKDCNGKSFDANVGSSVFSVEVHSMIGICSSGQYQKRKDSDKNIFGKTHG